MKKKPSLKEVLKFVRKHKYFFVDPTYPGIDKLSLDQDRDGHTGLNEGKYIRTGDASHLSEWWDDQIESFREVREEAFWGRLDALQREAQIHFGHEDLTALFDKEEVREALWAQEDFPFTLEDAIERSSNRTVLCIRDLVTEYSLEHRVGPLLSFAAGSFIEKAIPVLRNNKHQACYLAVAFDAPMRLVADAIQKNGTISMSHITLAILDNKFNSLFWQMYESPATLTSLDPKDFEVSANLGYPLNWGLADIEGYKVTFTN